MRSVHIATEDNTPAYLCQYVRVLDSDNTLTNNLPMKSLPPIAKNLRYLMAREGLTQGALAKKCNLNQPTIQRMVNGEVLSPKNKNGLPLAAFFAVPLEVLVAGDVQEWEKRTGRNRSCASSTVDPAKVDEPPNAFPGPDQFQYYPVLGSIPCGDFRDAIEFARNDPQTEWQPSPKRLVGGGFFLRATGKSMLPTIQEGDLVLIHPGGVVDPRKIVAVRNGDGEASLKRLTNEGGTLMLVPDNPQFPAIPLGDKKIVGVAVQIVREV